MKDRFRQTQKPTFFIREEDASTLYRILKEWIGKEYVPRNSEHWKWRIFTPV